VFKMIRGSDILNMLIPTGGWVINGDDYEGIQFIEATPITKEEYEAGFAQYETWKAEQLVAEETAKQQAFNDAVAAAVAAALAAQKE